jgi:hypothetical protein
MNSLFVRIRFQPRLTQLPAYPTLLHAPKWNPNIAIIARIDPHHSRLNVPCHTMRLCNILREQRRSQAVGAIIRAANSFLLRLEATNNYKRAEDFFAIDLHVVGDICEDGGGHEEAFSADIFVGFAAGDQCGAFRFSGFNVGEDAIELGFCDLGALEGVILPWIADYGSRFDVLFEGFDKLVVDAFLD